MTAVSSRFVLFIAFVLACLIFGIESWTRGILPWTPLWLLQIGLLGLIVYLLAREVRQHADSEARFAKIFHANPSGILLSRQADGCCLLANARFLELTGYTEAELLGHTTIELAILSPEQRRLLLDKLRAHGYAQGFDLQLTAHGGAAVDVHYVIVPIEIDGAVCLLSSFYDIRERKRMEDALRALNEQLEQRVAVRTLDLQVALAEQQHWLKLKGDFLGMVSHELRTPLTGVLAMTELLEEELGGSLSTRQHLYVQTAHRAGEQLLEIVNSITSYSHLISGEVELVFDTCGLAYLLEVAGASLQRKAQAKGQTFTVVVDPPDLQVTTDAAALTQVLRRLLDNAVKFTPAGEAIGVLAYSNPDGEHVHIVVWDTGAGLVGHSLADLVQPFRQGEARLTRHYEGMGMGLAYVHRMLPLLGGELALETSAQGSRFIVTLSAPGHGSALVNREENIGSGMQQVQVCAQCGGEAAVTSASGASGRINRTMPIAISHSDHTM
jgi:PAS domain S-box-containing protein